MNVVADAPMSPDGRVRRFLSRVLPWFDQAAWDRERRATRKALEAADRVRFEDIRTGYGQYSERLGRR